jgi:hypothetical protein
MHKTAIISDCGLFRYEIRGEWDASLPPLVGCLNNPSKADAMTDDPTWVRGVSRAQRNGFGSVIYVNAGAGRATDPADWKKMRDPIGPENDAHIRRVFEECLARGGLAYGGWGAHGTFKDRHLRVKRIASEVGLTLHCLGKTKDGQPRHPLYIPNDQPFEVWFTPRISLSDPTTKGSG